jgi:hypothetical protein
LELEDSTLSAFLQWSARENGYSLRYSSPAVASAAASTHLFGELAGLDETQAIDAVLATTTFRKLDSAAHELVIDFQR